MAYNLQVLIQILDQILHPRDHHRPNWILDPRKKPNIESLRAKAHFLNEIFENPSSVTSHAIRSLETRIRDAACRAQDVIQSHLADQLLSKTNAGRIFISPPSLREEFVDFGFQRIVDELGNVMDQTEFYFGIASSSHLVREEDLNHPKDIVVGISQDLIQLKERLVMPQQFQLEIIPIVGMGGIGKTTLARTLYNNQSVASWFDTRAWIVISQNYNEREILLGLLKCVTGKLSVEITQDDNDRLGLHLYKKLFGRRYLIVLDDMWSSEAWDCVKMFFPDDNNGSRIIVTTREQSVANQVAGTEKLHHQMKFLNGIESWKLLRRKLFPAGICHSELKEVGKNIARDCRGLPLAIHAVGGVLSRLDKTKETWIQVAKDVHSSMANSLKQFSNILSLSYSHLPNYLKPCFLYMSAFPEDCEIRASKLIKLWVAEGFIKPIPGTSFEETAQAYLKELVERNLLLVLHKETKGKVKSYIMHDSLRDLCIRKGREENFFYVANDSTKELDLRDMPQRRLRAHASYEEIIATFNRSGRAALPRSFLLFARCYDPNYSIVPLLDKVSSLQLLKVLDILAAKLVTLPKAMNRLVNLRYLAAYILARSNIPSSISSMCNLQTLVFCLENSQDSFVIKVQELFASPELRHIKFKKTYPLFTLGDGEKVALQEELQTLSTVTIDDSFPRILQAVPNLKKLGISKCHDASVHAIIDLRCLRKLEILRCSTGSGFQADYLESLVFPTSLKKLTLFRCALPHGFLKEIGCLPNLEVFKVQDSFFEGSNRTWKPTEGGFRQLKLLQLESFNLKEWIADETHYPRLERLVIRDCIYLGEIPSGIAEINTLNTIELHGRNRASVMESAKKIQEDRNQFGDDDLQIHINFTRGGAEANERDTRESEESEEEEEEEEEEEGDAQESGAKEERPESKGCEGWLNSDLEPTEGDSDLLLSEREIVHMVMETSADEHLADEKLKQLSIGESSTSGTEPSSSAAQSSGSNARQGGHELSSQGSVLSSTIQIMLSMGFSYLRVIEAYSIFEDDVPSMVCYLTETSGNGTP